MRADRGSNLDWKYRSPIPSTITPSCLETRRKLLFLSQDVGLGPWRQLSWLATCLCCGEMTSECTTYGSSPEADACRLHHP